jgi:hypothetical protein
MSEDIIKLEVRVAVLEQRSLSFETSAMEFMRTVSKEENSIHARLDDLLAQVHRIPDMINTKLAQTRADIRGEIDAAYARRHEVVTPKVLMAAATIMAAVLVAGMTGTMIVMDRISDAQPIEISYDVPERK